MTAIMAGMDGFAHEWPKAELHLHLEGSVEPATLLELGAGRDLEEVQTRLEYRDFAGFLVAFKWVLGWLRTPDDYALATRRLLEHLAAENVRYAEITLSAGALLWKGVPLGPVYDAVVREAANSTVETWWIFDAIRHFGADHAMQVARLAAERAGDRVVAFGIGGNERSGPAKLFGEVFAFARQQGLQLTAHAGEADGVESVRAALDIGAQRIGHGCAAARDEQLLQRLAREKIPLEVCLSSNLATGVVPELSAHPLRAFCEAGVPVVLSTDDPALFRTNLSAEYALAARAAGLDRAQLRELALNSFRFAFRYSGDWRELDFGK